MKKKEGELLEEWKKNLPIELYKTYTFISENAKLFNTFDLLSNIAYYNHLHDSENYSDNRGDKHFFITEVLSLLCLKGSFNSGNQVDEKSFLDLVMQIQKKTLKYCSLKNAIDFSTKMRGEDTVSDVSNILRNEAKAIRNPGLPEHHLIFAEKLFQPLNEEIKSFFGFSVSDSLIFRRSISDFLNAKYDNARMAVFKEVEVYVKEIEDFRKSKVAKKGGNFSLKNLKKYSLWADEKLRKNINIHLMNKLHFNLSEVLTFTVKEFSDFADVNVESTANFLNHFSCRFPAIKDDEEIYSTDSILKQKPILNNNDRYLIPSVPLLVWAVEEQFEIEIKKYTKLSGRYSKIKHDFVLDQGIEYFKKIMPTANFYPSNLFYSIGSDRFETDSVVLYDRVLFIVEAKAHRISSKAKSGHELRTENHLKEILKHSYEQGVRAFNYIDDKKVAEFQTKKGERIFVNRKDIDDVIIVSLTLEPIGNLAMAIKVTNELNYFEEKYFPWIISIYDLVSFADFFENPILFIHYLKRRKKFLSNKNFSTYEEMDLVAYYMQNGLYIDHTIEEAKRDKVDWIEFFPNTDEINNYYMHKFRKTGKAVFKPSFFISKDFNDFLLQLDNSKLSNRVTMALLILEFNSDAIKQLTDSIKKIKKDFLKNNKMYNASIFTKSLGGLGITFMICNNKEELEFHLYHYCQYKLTELDSNAWVGFGDMSLEEENINFQSMFVAVRKDASILQCNSLQ